MDDQDLRKLAGQRKPKQSEADRARGIEAQIREAMARGDFENLPGKGKPLALDNDGDGDHWLAHHLLKNEGLRPAWIDDDRAIREAREALDKSLADFVAWYAQATADLGRLTGEASADRRAELAQAAARRVADFRVKAEALNRQIDRFNLIVPIAGQQRRRVRVDEEVAAFRGRLDAVGRRA